MQPYSVRQVAELAGKFNFFQRTPFDDWEGIAAPTSYGQHAPPVGETSIIEGVFQFAYNTDLTDIRAQFRVKLHYQRTA